MSDKVKRDMVAIKQELDTVQAVKEEIEELREYVDRLEEHSHRRKLRLLEQVTKLCLKRTNSMIKHNYKSLWTLSFFEKISGTDIFPVLCNIGGCSRHAAVWL